MGHADPQPSGEWTGKTLVRRFTIAEPLGRGGMADVYRAHDARLGRDVAIKLLRTDIQTDVDIASRLVREARTIAQLVHPHIVSVHDVGRKDGVVFIIMELLDGHSIADLLHDEEPLGVELTLEVGRQVASALAAAHRLGVVHRDVKPENMFIVNSVAGVLVKLFDFSLAHVPGSEATIQLARKGITFGTPHYMAPELSSPSKVGPAVDIYALGIVLWEMLVGLPPYDGDTFKEVLLAHRKTMIPRVDAQRMGLPDGLGDLLFQMMAKIPGRRPGAEHVMHRFTALLTAVRDQPTKQLPADSPPDKQQFRPRSSSPSGGYNTRAYKRPARPGATSSGSFDPEPTQSLVGEARMKRRLMPSGGIALPRHRDEQDR